MKEGKVKKRMKDFFNGTAVNCTEKCIKKRNTQRKKKDKK